MAGEHLPDRLEDVSSIVSTAEKQNSTKSSLQDLASSIFV
jgi:hypothetical protein